MTAIPSSERLDGLIQCALLIEDVLNWLGAHGWRALLKSQILHVIIRTCVVTPSSPSNFEFFDIITRTIYKLKKYLVHYSVLLPTVRSLKALDRVRLWNNDCLNSIDRDELCGAWYEFRQCVEARKPVLKEYKQTILRTPSNICDNIDVRVYKSALMCAIVLTATLSALKRTRTVSGFFDVAAVSLHTTVRGLSRSRIGNVTRDLCVTITIGMDFTSVSRIVCP